MNLIIDAGNTRIKIYKASGNRLTAPLFFSYKAQDQVHEFLKHEAFDNTILANVSNPELSFISYLSEKSKLFINFNQSTPIPIKNAYKSKETLGYDRLASAIGASAMFPDENVLVIDAGTAITLDIVSENTYRGGAIAPGLQMRFDALHQFTKRLPGLTYDNNFNCPGQTTRESILCGCIEGIRNEVLGTIATYRKEYSGLKTVITGGDADIFVKMIKNGIFAEPNLLAKGLNRILNYNVEKN